MDDSTPPQPYVPESLLDFISRDTLEHLLTGFREKLRGGVALYCKDQQGNTARLDADDTPEGRRFWSELCECFRFKMDRNQACRDFDKEMAEKLLEEPVQEPITYDCRPLGLKEMAAQVVVCGKPLAVVLMGQRLPRYKPDGEKILLKMRTKYSDPRDTRLLQEAFEEDYKRDYDDSPYSNLYDLQELPKLVAGLKGFAEIISDLATSVAEKEIRVREREFRDYWIKGLSDARPQSLTEWQKSLQECLDSFQKFVGGDIERIGLFKGDREGNEIRYSLMAMNSPNWWKWKRFRVAGDYLRKEQHFVPGTLPRLVRGHLEPAVADTKYFSLYPSSQEAARRFGEVFLVAAVQATRALSTATDAFCRDFFDALSRLDATSRLFLRQNAMYEQFQQQVVEVSHDLKTSVQHIVDNIDNLLREVRRGVSPGSKAGQELRNMVKRSVVDHVVRVKKLRTPSSEGGDARLESINIFSAVAKQVDLYRYTARRKRIEIDTSGLSKENAYVVCEPGELARGIAALLDNAIKYSFSGKTVIVSGKIEGNSASIVFDNYGIGIPPDKLKEITKRSVRGNVMDSKDIRPGMGLGLSIASQVFEKLLQGRLELDSYRPHADPDALDNYHRFVTRARVMVPLHI